MFTRVWRSQDGMPENEVTGIAHELCNLQHNHEHDTPRFWKMNRARWRHIGAKVAKGRPLAGTRASGIKKSIDGQVLDRRTGEPWRPGQ